MTQKCQAFYTGAQRQLSKIMVLWQDEPGKAYRQVCSHRHNYTLKSATTRANKSSHRLELMCNCWRYLMGCWWVFQLHCGPDPRHISVLQLHLQHEALQTYVCRHCKGRSIWLANASKHTNRSKYVYVWSNYQ